MTEITIENEIPSGHYNIAHVRCDPSEVQKVLDSKCADFYFIYCNVTNEVDIDVKSYYVCFVKENNGKRLIAYQDHHDGEFAYKNLKPMPTMVVSIEVLIAINEGKAPEVIDPVPYLTAKDFILSRPV